jgi:hypothetical protein
MGGFSFLNAPPVLADLDSVPPEFHALYELTDDGLYTLTPVASAEIEILQDERRQLEEEHARKLAELQGESSRRAAELRSVRAESCLRQTLLDGGCRPELVKGAVAMLRDEWRIIGGDSAEALLVVTDAGLVPLQQMVREFLTSEAGSVFMPARPAKHGDRFSRELMRIVR